MLSKTMTILLGIIHNHSVNAYELDKQLSSLGVRNWYSIASSTVYATLRTAEKRGYIKGDITKDGRMPDKTIYLITDNGKQLFLDAIRGYLSGFEYDITSFHIGIFFIRSLEQEELVSLLEKRLKDLRQFREVLAGRITDMEKAHAPKLICLNTMQDFYIIEAQLKGTEGIAAELKVSIDNPKQ